MATKLTADDARQSLNAHLAAKGVDVFCAYGPPLRWTDFERLLQDPDHVRYPCRVAFDAGPLLPGECAHPVAHGPRPEDGFTLYIHPHFADDRDRIVYHALYQLVAVNYGDFASTQDAETFGAAALGLTCDEYYAALCALADELAAVGA